MRMTLQRVRNNMKDVLEHIEEIEDKKIEVLREIKKIEKLIELELQEIEDIEKIRFEKLGKLRDKIDRYEKTEYYIKFDKIRFGSDDKLMEIKDKIKDLECLKERRVKKVEKLNKELANNFEYLEEGKSMKAHIIKDQIYKQFPSILNNYYK